MCPYHPYLNLLCVCRKRAKIFAYQTYILFGDEESYLYPLLWIFFYLKKTYHTRDLNCTRIHTLNYVLNICLSYLAYLCVNFVYIKDTTPPKDLPYSLEAFICFASERKCISSNCKFNTLFAKSTETSKSSLIFQRNIHTLKPHQSANLCSELHFLQQ